METNIQLNQFNRELGNVQEEQIETKQDVQQLELVKDDFFDIHLEGRRLFDRILQTWYEDEELRMKLEQCHIELNRHADNITAELDQQKDGLINKQRHLKHQEEEILEKINYLHREEKL